MNNYIKQFSSHPLIRGSFILVLGTNAANVFNYLFNLFMSRNLSVADYGALASIIALIGLPGYVMTAVVPTVIKFAGEYIGRKRLDLARGLFVKLYKGVLLIIIFLFAGYLIFINQIAGFFKIDDISLLIISIFIVVFSMLGLINYAFIQAKLAFKFLVSLSLISSILKLILGIVFVLMGYSVGGAVLALLFAAILGYFYSFKPLRFVFAQKTENVKINSSELIKYGIPSGLALFGLALFINMDIILVKHLFSEVDAGLYAGLSLIAKVILYVSSPVGSVMFPLIVQKHAKGENTTHTFFMALLLVCGSSIMLTLFYFIFPEFMIKFFLKEEYLRVSGLLGIFGVFVSLYTLAFILVNFYLSIKKTNVYIPVLIGAGAQSILIYIMHDSFAQIIWISLIIIFVLNILLLIYYPYATREKLQT